MAGGVVKIFNSLNDVINTYGVPHLSKDRLSREGLQHILIRESGYLRLSLILPKSELFNMMNKNFIDIVSEKIKGFVGVYGYLGVNSNLLASIKEIKEIDAKVYVVVAEYEGPFLTVNSGPLTGMAIITENIQNINFKTITS